MKRSRKGTKLNDIHYFRQMPAHPRTKMTCLRVMRGDGVDVTPEAVQLEGGRTSPTPKLPVSPNKNQKHQQQSQQRERRTMIELHQPSVELAAISYSSQDLMMPVVPCVRAERETQLEERILAELELEAKRREIANEEERIGCERRGEPVDAKIVVSQRRGEIDSRDSSDLLDSDHYHHHQPLRRRRSRCTQTDHPTHHHHHQHQPQQPPSHQPQQQQSSGKSSSWWRELSLGRLLASFVSYLLGRRPPAANDDLATSAPNTKPGHQYQEESSSYTASSDNSRLVEVHELDAVSRRNKRLVCDRDVGPLVPCKRVDDDSLRLAYMHSALKASSRRYTDDAIDNDEYSNVHHGVRRVMAPRARQLSSPLT